MHPKGVLRVAHTKSYRAFYDGGRYTRLHVARAERALGKKLPPGAEVHHVDGTHGDDSPLVICQDHAYHYFLHFRERILRAGGNPNTDRICCDCGPRPIAAFGPSKRPGGAQSRCRACRNLRNKRIANAA